jgi:hypothetical protein
MYLFELNINQNYLNLLEIIESVNYLKIMLEKQLYLI